MISSLHNVGSSHTPAWLQKKFGNSFGSVFLRFFSLSNSLFLIGFCSCVFVAIHSFGGRLVSWGCDANLETQSTNYQQYLQLLKTNTNSHLSAPVVNKPVFQITTSQLVRLLPFFCASAFVFCCC
jgi:hypothetical protein